MTPDEVWQKYKARFDYWCRWAERELGSVPKCHDWWSSRFHDDTPWYDKNGFNEENFALRNSFEPIWTRFIAPALGIDIKTTQLRLM